MTDLEKMEEIIDFCKKVDWVKEPKLEDLIKMYLIGNREDFNIIRLNSIARLFSIELGHKIEDTYQDIYNSQEKAKYVEMYLKGQMYTNEETAKENLPLQIGHIEEVVKRLKDNL